MGAYTRISVVNNYSRCVTSQNPITYGGDLLSSYTIPRFPSKIPGSDTENKAPEFLITEVNGEVLNKISVSHNTELQTLPRI